MNAVNGVWYIEADNGNLLGIGWHDGKRPCWRVYESYDAVRLQTLLMLALLYWPRSAEPLPLKGPLMERFRLGDPDHAGWFFGNLYGERLPSGTKIVVRRLAEPQHEEFKVREGLVA